MKKILLSASAAALLLGSCSKDDAELATAVNTGKTAFVAGMTIGNDNDTRVHLEGRTYLWDAGDMVGVSTGSKNENIPFVSKLGGSSAAFEAVKEDLSYLGEGTYYMVYPYDKTTEFTNDGDEVKSVKMTIPAVQRYRNNSFATMTAPAVAVVKDYTASAKIMFQPVASYIRVKVNGAGTLKKLKLEIKKEGEAEYENLAGTDDLDLTAENYSLAFGTTVTDEDKSVTIDCGAGGIELAYNEAKELMFVIPAGIDLKNAEIKLSGMIGDASEAEVISYKAPTSEFITKANEITPFNTTLTFGLKGKALITNEDEFLRYVYSVNTYAANDADAPEDLVWENEGVKEYKTALIINDLDCSKINDRLISQVPVNMYDAYVWYLRTNDENFIFPASAEFMLAGDDAKNPVTIANMNVKTTGGVGIFENNADASLENIIIKNAVVTVDNKDLKKTDVAKFLANDNMDFKNVKVDGGEIKAAVGTTFGKAALLGSVKASELEQNKNLVKEGAYPRCGEKEILVAESLNIDADVNLTDYVAAAPKFGEINGGEAGKQITVKDVALDDVKASIMAIIAETEDAKYFSVMFTEGSTTTSLWTGLKGNFTDGQIRTAEDLVAAVAELKTADVTAALKNNIDLLGKKWISVDNAINAITINGNKFTLRNVNITNYTYNAEKKENVIDDVYALTAAHTFSVFGKEADVTSLNVEGLTIDIIGGEVNEEEGEILGEVSVGGLALEGAANYVNLTGATIKVADDVNLKKDDKKMAYVGGIMTEKKGASDNNTAVVTFDCPEGTETDAYFAK